MATAADGAEAWAGGVRRVLEELDAMQARQASFTAAARRLVAMLSVEPPPGAPPANGVDLPALVAEYERSVVLWALARAGGQQLDAARLLGVKASTLNEKMKRLGIARPCEAQAPDEAHAVISIRGRREPSTSARRTSSAR